MKLLKRISKLFLTLLLVLSLFSCAKIEIVKNETSASKSEVNEKTNNYGDVLVSLSGDVTTLSKYPLPKVGDKLFGFAVDAIYDYDYRNAKLVLMTHEKSGAKVILISNDDEDKCAVFGFNTLTFDNKGIPHVFEHSCLGGSEKYPNANLFDEAINRTYKTYLNAFTLQHATAYPFSSLSDTQLFEFYKFYMDGVLNPDVLRDEKNLEREAYRYILYDKAEDISMSGVVYSEMSGVEGNIANVAYRNSLKAMYEGSFMGVNTGGDTTDIPTISNQELIDFHEKFYHPSNMVVTLYGDIDYEKYLKYSDEEYLSHYDKKIIDKSDDNYKAQQGFKTKTFDFPSAENDDISGRTLVFYSVKCDDLSLYEKGLFYPAIRSLIRSDGPIDRRVKEKLPNASFDYLDLFDYPKPSFAIVFSNVDESDADVIKEIVEESFAEIVRDGIKSEIIDEIVDSLEIDKEIAKDSHGFADASANFYTKIFKDFGNDVLGELRYQKGLEDVRVAYENGDIKKLIDKYLSSNDNSSMTITVPRKGLAEKKAESNVERLKNMKASMSDEELDALIKKTTDYDEWIEYQASHSLIDKLRVASVSSLDEYRAKCYAYEETIEGVHFIRSDIADSKTNYVEMLFDTSGIKLEDAQKLELVSSLLLELPTTNYEGRTLKAELDRYAYNYYFGKRTNYYDGGGFKPYFSFSYRALDKNIDKIFELFEELMFETKFEDVNVVKRVVSSKYNELKFTMLSNPRNFADSTLLAQNDEDYLYDYYLSGPEYLKFLEKVSNMSDDEIKILLAECKEILLSIYNRSGFVCKLISNFNTIKTLKSKVVDLSYDFKDEKIKAVDFTNELSPLKNRLAFVCSGTMQYNYIILSMKKNNIEYNGRYAVLSSILDDKILYPEFRAKRSAYGSYSTMSKKVAYLYTYRDPNLKESYEVYNSIPNLIKEISVDKDEFEDYKLNAYATYSYPLTKFNAAMIAIEETFNKTKDKRADRYIRYMRDVKNVQLEDLPELYKMVDTMIGNGSHLTIGGRAAIESNTDLFDEIIYNYIE